MGLLLFSLRAILLRSDRHKKLSRPGGALVLIALGILSVGLGAGWSGASPPIGAWGPASGAEWAWALALWVGGLWALGAGFLFYFFPTIVVIPTLLQAIGCFALAGVLALGQSYARSVEELMAATRGDLMVTRKGRDFFEYRELQGQIRRHLEATACVQAVLPVLVVHGLAYPQRPSFGASHRPMAKSFVLRGMAPEDFAKSRVFAHLLSPDAAKVSAPQPADRQRAPQIWLGQELARSLGLGVGEEVILSVRARQAIRDEGGLRYAFSSRERRFEIRRLLDFGELELNRHLALASLSATQALAHGRPWVSAIDLELCPEAWPKLLPTAKSLKKALPRDQAYSVSSWRHSAERLRLQRNFRAGATVITLGLFMACALSVALGVMVLIRRKRSFFTILDALGATPGQMRGLAFALVALPTFGGGLLGWLQLWGLTRGPAIALPLGLGRPVHLRFLWAPWDASLVLAMMGLSLAIAWPLVGAELNKSRADRL